jgi:hypothetical protein
VKSPPFSAPFTVSFSGSLIAAVVIAKLNYLEL